MEQLSARLLLTAGILLLIAGVIFAILQVWLYTDLLWAGAFGCLMAALNFRDAETEKTAELMDNVSKLYEELISFSDLYDSASFEAKKMIVNQLIRRVDVYRGYQLNITFNFDLTPYIEGDDAAAC